MVPHFFRVVFFGFLESVIAMENDFDGQITLRETKSCLNANQLGTFEKVKRKNRDGSVRMHFGERKADPRASDLVKSVKTCF